MIPDPVEQGESRAERWAEEHIRGDEFLCSCGKWVLLLNGLAATADPYSPLICWDCAPEPWREQYKATCDTVAKGLSPFGVQETDT